MVERPDNSSDRICKDFDIDSLRQITAKVSVAAPLQELLGQAVAFIVSLIECDSCIIYAMEEDVLVPRASKNPLLTLVDQMKMKIDRGIAEWVAEHRVPVVVSNGAYNDRRLSGGNQPPEDRFEAFLSIPVICGGRLVCVINVQNRQPYEYTEREITLIAVAGLLVGAEIERARLESENAQLTDKLEVRKVIERAKGMLQRSLNLSEEDAYRALQRESQMRRKPMREIADAIILSNDLSSGSKH
jgi:uroporphyrinogen-III synthase